MGATLDALHRLQQIETQLRSVREQIDSRRRTIQTHQRREATLKRQIADQHDAIQKAQMSADKLELERKTHEEHIARMRDTLNRAKTNKEYAAVLSQLNTDKADTMKIEDSVLAAMNRVDELKREEAQFRQSLEKEEVRIRELDEAASDLEARLANQLSTLERQRAAAAGAIPKDALVLFERACDKHDGQAMAIIEQPHPKREEYICSGCNMSVTLETVSALRSRDSVQQCHTCQRILFVESSASVSV